MWEHKEIEIKDIAFEVDSDNVVGVLRIPDVARPIPALVFAGPLTSVKDQVTGNYAQALAVRGFVTLSFDHRHFGESSGKPRQYEHPKRKVEDLRTALGYLKSRVEVAPQRIGAVGVCAGAGYLAAAVAKDPRIAAWGTVAGFFHDADQQKAWLGAGYDVAIERARHARVQFETSGECEMIPAVGEGDVAMPMPEAFAYYGTERGATPHYVNEFAVMSREHTLPWDAQSVAPKIKIPTLMIHSENALAPGLARKFFAALAGPKKELWVQSNGQIDFYDDPKQIEPAADELAKHFRANM
jgi:hypothetical protein